VERLETARRHGFGVRVCGLGWSTDAGRDRRAQTAVMTQESFIRSARREMALFLSITPIWAVARPMSTTLVTACRHGSPLTG
jgi:hypothetical protein